MRFRVCGMVEDPFSPAGNRSPKAYRVTASFGLPECARIGSVEAQLFCCKSIDQLLSDSENAEVRLKKSLGWLSLTSLGIGAVIGSGIFTIIGTAIAGQKFKA